MNTTVNHYKSISEFYKYICDTPFNEAFRWARHSSVENDYWFSHTHSFDEAVDLLKNGWDDMAQKLTQKLNVQASPEVQRQMQTIIGVAGFQPIVPLYLTNNLIIACCSAKCNAKVDSKSLCFQLLYNSHCHY